MKLSTGLKSLITGVALLSLPVAAQESTGATSAVPALEAEKKGHWDDIVYGSLDAPVELVEYASLTCSHCGHFAREIFPKLKEKYIDTGKVRLRFRNFILNSTDFALAVVSRCKGEDLARKMTHSFLSKQASWLGQENPVAVLEAIATIDGLPINEFEKCMENDALAAHLSTKRKEWADTENIHHTPTVKLDGVELAPPTWIKLETAIEMKLASQK